MFDVSLVTFAAGWVRALKERADYINEQVVDLEAARNPR